MQLLAERGALDPFATPPDLSRWRRRALRKAGVQRAEQDPQAFARHYEELTARDRAVASPYGLARFKLTSPSGWIVGEEEIERLQPALTEGLEELRAFVRGGPFEVRE